MWIVDVLWTELPRIEANEMLRLVTAAQVPYMDQDDRRQLIRYLGRLAGREEPTPEPIEVIEHNPEKAAEWFREQGVYIESA
jgi:hypothetical protein